MKTDLDFLTEIEVSIYPTDKEKYVDDFKTLLSYDVDIEYRSWGIKDVYPLFQSEITITYFEKDVSDVEIEKSITFNPNDLQKEFVESVDGVCCPKAIELWMLPDGTVDIKRSTITIWMMKR